MIIFLFSIAFLLTFYLGYLSGYQQAETNLDDKVNIKEELESTLKDLLDTYWIMLRECETIADKSNDKMLKHWVESWYKQYNKSIKNDLTFQLEPVWKTRTKGN